MSLCSLPSLPGHNSTLPIVGTQQVCRIKELLELSAVQVIHALTTSCCHLLGLLWRQTASRETCTTETRLLTVLEAGSLRSRCLQGWFPPEGCGGKSVSPLSLSFWRLLGIFSVPWLVEAPPNLCLHPHMAFSKCVHLRVNFPFDKGPSHIGQGCSLMTSHPLYFSYRDSVSQ